MIHEIPYLDSTECPIRLGEISNDEQNSSLPPTILDNSNRLIDTHEINKMLTILVKYSYYT